MNDNQKPHNPWVAPTAPVADIAMPVATVPQTVAFSFIAMCFIALPALVIGFSTFSKKARAWYAR